MPLQDSWLKHLEEPVEDETSRSHTIKLAEREGLHLFQDGEASAAAEYFKRNGFVVLMEVVQGRALHSLQRTSAQLIRESEWRHPEGTRGNQRWSLNRTTGHRQVGMACIAPVDNERICAVLQNIWHSEDFTLLCTGGDFSLPGAARQPMHADIGRHDRASSYFVVEDYLKIPSPPTVKVYITLTPFDESTGPPVFVPGSHLRYDEEDCPVDDPACAKFAYCPQGSALIMDLRVWHHGSPNTSQLARPMLALHYAAPWYNECVLTQENMYWIHHRGVICSKDLMRMGTFARKLCRHLVHQQCKTCRCLSTEADPSSGWHNREWFCESCCVEWRKVGNRGSTARKRWMECWENETLEVDCKPETVKYAWYGDPENDRNGEDVTLRVRDLLQTSTSMRATNEELGCDPAHKVRKKLYVQMQG